MDEVKVFKVTSNPILRTDRGTRQIMLDVIIGLIPALAVAVYMFGAKVVLLLAVSIEIGRASCRERVYVLV